jgi:hypothetical protein
MIETGQVPVGTTATLVCRVPPGPCTAILFGGTTTVYFGSGTAVGTAAANGAPLYGSATVTIPGYPGSSGTPIYAVASIAGTVNIGFVLSTDS